MENDYYRIKLSYIGENAEGGLDKFKPELLVMAGSYGNAEKIALDILEEFTKFGGVNYEIVKIKTGEFIYSNLLSTDSNKRCGLVNYYFESDEEGVGIYTVLVNYKSVDEKSGKDKIEKETLFAPATSPKNAVDVVSGYIKYVGESRDWYISKVNLDKADEVLVTEQQHKINLDI